MVYALDFSAVLCSLRIKAKVMLGPFLVNSSQAGRVAAKLERAIEFERYLKSGSSRAFARKRP